MIHLDNLHYAMPSELAAHQARKAGEKRRVLPYTTVDGTRVRGDSGELGKGTAGRRLKRLHRRAWFRQTLKSFADGLSRTKGHESAADAVTWLARKRQK